MSIELDEVGLDTINAIRITRHNILSVRLLGMCERYPEVVPPEIRPLTDAEIVRLALARELAHQEQVAKDMAK